MTEARIDAPADEADAIHGFQFAHDRFERPDAGDHEAVGVQDVLGLGAEDDLSTGALECPDSRTDIPGTVVQHGDGRFPFGRRRLHRG